MTSQMELLKLCKKIKGLIPSKHVEEDATDPYQEFLKNLEINNIDPHEIECIKRAHNYFNFILNSNELNSLDSGRRDPDSGPISLAPNVESRASTPSVIPKPNTEEERLQLLIELYLAKDAFKEMKDKALSEMNSLSASITIPDSKLSEDALIKAFDPFVEKLSAQVEKAKELNKYIPCPSLIDAANEVWKEAKGIKQQTPTSDQARQKINKQQITRSIEVVKDAQERVKKILRTLT